MGRVDQELTGDVGVRFTSAMDWTAADVFAKSHGLVAKAGSSTREDQWYFTVAPGADPDAIAEHLAGIPGVVKAWAGTRSRYVRG